jgi:hypothetical protein
MIRREKQRHSKTKLLLYHFIHDEVHMMSSGNKSGALLSEVKVIAHRDEIIEEIVLCLQWRNGV